ncbi:hypothetical protein ACLMJK_001865 [Lecanora helva]
MLFPIRNKAFHAQVKAPIAGHYSMSGLVKLERPIDEVIELMLQKLNTKVGDGSDGEWICNMDQWLQYSQEQYPERVDDSVLWCYALTNVVAGSDTVAIPLRSVLYYVLSDQEKYLRLMQEIDKADIEFPISWKDARRLPYLDAVIQEALRIHPPVGLGPERIVGQAGLKLDNGVSFSEGTQVSVNAWAVHRCAAIFGRDLDDFRPERWLQSDDETSREFEDRLQGMKKAFFTFGFGSRACIGKNLSLIEIYKLIPMLFRSFDMELIRAEWKTQNSWFVRQEGLEIRLRQRAVPTKTL